MASYPFARDDQLIRRAEAVVQILKQRRLTTVTAERSPASMAIAVTGVVGPNPDEDGAQPGHVFFGMARRQGMVAVKEDYLRFATPDEVRRAIIERALDLLRAAAAQDPRA